MPSFGEDDDDRDLPASPDGSSDNDLDDTMRDADDAEAEGDAEPEPDSPSNSSQASESFNDRGAELTQQNPEVLLTSPSPPGSSGLDPSIPTWPSVRPEALTAATYDIVPTIAAPQSTSINAITATADMRWVFSGGTDGYLRKYNWVDTVNGKLMLTVAQKHPFVDSVVKAGVLMTYWENWDVPSRTGSNQGDEGTVLSPVYSLAAQNQGLWLVAGLESGNIRLQSVRHDAGKEIALLQKHTSAVSVLRLSQDEKSLLSGSWDKSVHEWDLNTGQVRTSFGPNASQISAIASRPLSSIPVPEESGYVPPTNGTFSTNNHVNGGDSDGLMNGIANSHQDSPIVNGDPATASPADSLFGGNEEDNDSLFGDGDASGTGPGALSGAGFGDDEGDDFSRAIANPSMPDEADQQGDTTMGEDSLQPVQAPDTAADPAQADIGDDISQPAQLANGTTDAPTGPLTNGLPHVEDVDYTNATLSKPDPSPTTEVPPTSDSTFLAASIDGIIRIWDRREPNPVAKVLPRNSPPWCMDACWSPDGNYIYAGRRNCTVEEYDLRMGLKEPQRTFKFPLGSGPVTSVKAMPNGRHLVCGSFDILRLYDLKESASKHSTVPFLIVPGHRTGVVSQLFVDPTCRFMISTGGNRGWEGYSTEVLLGYEIGVGN